MFSYTYYWARRLIAKWTHKHEWEVIFRSKLVWRKLAGTKGKNPLVLQRCHCGAERAREYEYGRWKEVDIDWLNYELAEQGIEIPARTHGVKP